SRVQRRGQQPSGLVVAVVHVPGVVTGVLVGDVAGRVVYVVLEHDLPGGAVRVNVVGQRFGQDSASWVVAVLDDPAERVGLGVQPPVTVVGHSLDHHVAGGGAADGVVDHPVLGDRGGPVRVVVGSAGGAPELVGD